MVISKTTSAVGVSSIHVNKQDDKILRYAHPANSTIVAITKGNPTILEVDSRDTKIVKGDFVTLTGSAVGGYNTAIKHVEVTKVVGSQRYNDYKTTITVDANTLLKFVGSVDPADTFVVAENVTFYDDGTRYTLSLIHI